MNIEDDRCQKYSNDNVKIRELIEREIKMMSSVQEGFETSASNQHTKVRVLSQSISNSTNRKDQELMKLKLSTCDPHLIVFFISLLFGSN